MASLLEHSDFIIEFRDKNLYCKVDLSVKKDITIKGYYVRRKEDGVKFSLIKTDYIDFVFPINKTGQYAVAVFYSNNNESELGILSEFIYCERENYHKDIIINEINVIPIQNGVMCDLSDAIKYVSCFKSISLELSGQSIASKISDVTKFFINQSGNYYLKLLYEDFSGETQEIIIDLGFLSYSEEEHLHHDYSPSKYLLFHIIHAFVVREFQRKYNKGYFRYFSIILGPSVQLGIMVLIFTLMGRKSVVGLSIPLFVLTGILPYGFFTSAGNCLTIVSGNRDLLNYRQVKIIDVIISSILMELMVVTTVFSIGFLVCKYFGLNVIIYNPLSLFLAFIILFFLTFGLGMILSVIGFYFAEFNYAIQIIFRALFYISGVFFSVENIPVQYQKYVLWNPLLQVIEFIRFSFVSFSLPHELSYIYLLKCTVLVFLLGISLYFINRNKFMINDRAR